ncbi:hypothetical protein BN2537_15089 [Streptomyces venezuelae]|nr:hypothetical protein BN2537_15089 [Streptomyces venezuelae]
MHSSSGARTRGEPGHGDGVLTGYSVRHPSPDEVRRKPRPLHERPSAVSFTDGPGT